MGAHYDRNSSAQRPLDNWSGAAILPALYQSLREQKAQATVLFSWHLPITAPSRWALSFLLTTLVRAQLEHAVAMVNVDALGLSPTKVWTAHSDKDLVHSLIVMVYALKLSASQIDIAAVGTTDSDPFAARHIPQITIHSLTQQNVSDGRDHAIPSQQLLRYVSAVVRLSGLSGPEPETKAAL